MWILLIPLVIAEIVFWGALAYFAWRAFSSIRSGHWPSATVFASLISIPFVFYSQAISSADEREAARMNEIAAFARSETPQSYPRLLEVYGQATDFELLIFLDVLKFEEVIVFQRPRRGQIYGRFVTLASGCRGLGVAHLETWRKRQQFSAPEPRDKACLVAEWKTVTDDRSGLPAVVYRQGTQSTLLPPGNNWASGAYEVRVRSVGANQLIDYWERPFITRPAEPGPWGYAFPANTDREKYKQPRRLGFFLAALGLE